MKILGTVAAIESATRVGATSPSLGPDRGRGCGDAKASGLEEPHPLVLFVSKQATSRETRPLGRLRVFPSRKCSLVGRN
jgi:hypothetical protein